MPRQCTHPLRIWQFLAIVVLVGCATENPSLSSPAQTFRIYKQAVMDDQPERVWACFSQGYRHLLYEDDLQRWLATWESERPGRLAAVKRLQISAEEQIGRRLGYLQFDGTTVAAGESPFFYFLREDDGWRITTHLDSSFRQALEEAVERGEYRVPSPP